MLGAGGGNDLAGHWVFFLELEYYVNAAYSPCLADPLDLAFAVAALAPNSQSIRGREGTKHAIAQK